MFGRVALDKSEGVVKGTLLLSGAQHRVGVPGNICFEDQRLWHLTVNHFAAELVVPPTIDSTQPSAMILLCEHPVVTGCESAQSTSTA